jgi:hypothetical protein
MGFLTGHETLGRRVLASVEQLFRIFGGLKMPLVLGRENLHSRVTTFN